MANIKLKRFRLGFTADKSFAATRFATRVLLKAVHFFFCHLHENSSYLGETLAFIGSKINK